MGKCVRQMLKKCELLGFDRRINEFMCVLYRKRCIVHCLVCQWGWGFVTCLFFLFALLFAVPSSIAAPIPGVLPYGANQGGVSSRPSLDRPSLNRPSLNLPAPARARPARPPKTESIKTRSVQPTQELNEPVVQGARGTNHDKILLFNTVEFKRPLSSLPAWLRLLERNAKANIFVSGKQFTKNMTWNSFKQTAQSKKGLELVKFVHTFWNQFPYREDLLNWGVQDYWEIPDEFLKKSGDCEDYAIIKYFTLKELGFPEDSMRIVVLRDTVRNLAHAVLVVYLNGDAYVLDNLSASVLSHTRFKHYLPQYSINEHGRWAHLKGRPVKSSASAQ